jgi:hypothetical protein
MLMVSRSSSAQLVLGLQLILYRRSSAPVVISPSKQGAGVDEGVGVVDMVVMVDELCTDPGLTAH